MLSLTGSYLRCRQLGKAKEGRKEGRRRKVGEGRKAKEGRRRKEGEGRIRNLIIITIDCNCTCLYQVCIPGLLLAHGPLDFPMCSSDLISLSCRHRVVLACGFFGAPAVVTAYTCKEKPQRSHLRYKSIRIHIYIYIYTYVCARCLQ